MRTRKTNEFTDAYNKAILYLEEHKNFPEEEEMKLLVGQYYYGIAAQKELENLMYRINLPKS